MDSLPTELSGKPNIHVLISFIKLFIKSVCRWQVLKTYCCTLVFSASTLGFSKVACWFQTGTETLSFMSSGKVLPFLILSMKVKVLVSLSCPTICYLMDCSPSGSSVHEILQARTLEWVAITSPGIEHGSPASQADSLLFEPARRPIVKWMYQCLLGLWWTWRNATHIQHPVRWQNMPININVPLFPLPISLEQIKFD